MIKIHDIWHLIAIKGKIARIKIVSIKIADGKPGYCTVKGADIKCYQITMSTCTVAI
jgi:hypothetical protein